MSELSLGTIYDINKNIMSNQKTLSLLAIENKRKLIKNRIEKNNFKYYILLCHERRDYTVLHLLDTVNSSEKISSAIIECLNNRGNIIGINPIENETFEIWININKEAFCYYLIPYDDGVIEE